MSERQELKAQQDRENASAVLSAGARGYSQRRNKAKKKAEESSAAVSIQARIRGKKEREDPASEANVRRLRLQNDPHVQATAYLKKHNILVCPAPSALHEARRCSAAPIAHRSCSICWGKC